MPSRLAHVCACLGTAWLVVGQHSVQQGDLACEAHSAGGAGAEQPPVALMQLKTAVQKARGTTSASLQASAAFLGFEVPAMRTLVSTSPSKSAHFMTTYLRARAVPAPSCSGAEVAAVEVELGPGIHTTYTFVKDSSKAAGDWTPDRVVPLITQTWQDFMAGNSSHVAWEDNHDAFPSETFLEDKAVADGVPIARYSEEMILKVNLPGTVWAFEFTPMIVPNVPSSCRDGGVVYSTAWRKATIMASNPVAAQQFVVNVLGAEQIPSLSEPGCPVALWAQFPSSGWQMHFVLSDTSPPRSLSVAELLGHMGSFRDLSGGKFDVWMYDSLVFPVDSLDPLVERLQSHGFLFFVMRLEDQPGYALFTDLPGTGVTLQFRSPSVANTTETLPQGACMPHLPTQGMQVAAERAAPAPLESARPIWWLHVAKCGSSLGNALIHLPGMCLPSMPSDYTFGLDADWYKEYPPSEYCPGSFVEEGRFSAGDHSALGVSPMAIVKGHGVTMLRQPEQRIMSAYWDNQHSWPTWYYERLPADPLEFAKAVSGCAVRMLVRDVPSHRAGHHEESACGSLEPATSAEVSLAKQRLRGDFLFVGITEEWELSMCLLHAVFGGDCLATDFLNSHPSQFHDTTSEYDTSGLQGYKDIADRDLYAEAKLIFQVQLQQYGVSQETCQPCFKQAASR